MIAPVVWITGRPASGKSTLANQLCAALLAREVRATVLDSDEMRAFVTPDPRYDEDERAMMYRALAYTAERLAREGVVAIVAATAHQACYRAWARSRARRFLLVHASAPAPLCEARDPKALYRRAHQTTTGSMPGVHVPYEEPTDAEVTVDTSTEVSPSTIDALVARIGKLTDR